MWPKGTIVICINDENIHVNVGIPGHKPSGLVKDYLYTVDKAYIGGDGVPSVVLVEYPQRPTTPESAWVAARFRKLEETSKDVETFVAETMKIERKIHQLQDI